MIFVGVLYREERKALECDIKTLAANKLLSTISSVGFNSDDFAPRAFATGFGKDVVELDLSESKTLAELGVSERDVVVLTSKKPPVLSKGKSRKKREQKSEEDSSGSGLSSDSLDPETVLAQLEKAKSGDTKVMLDFVDKKAKVIFETKSFVNASEKTLVTILSRDTLQAPENLVFEAAMRWGKHQTKKASPSPAELKTALAKILPVVRFGILSSKEFASQVVPSGLLDQAQTLEFFTHLAKRDSKQKPTKEGLQYKDRVKIGFHWAPDTQRNFVLSDENKTATSVINQICIAIGSEIYTQGKHRWELKVDGQGHMAIGISRPGLAFTTQICSQASLATSIHGTATAMSGTGLTSSITSRAVNTVGLLLDLDALRLTYFFNGVDVGSCTIPKDSYNPAISVSGSAVSTFTLTSYEQL